MSKELIRFVPILGVLFALAGPAHAVKDKQIKAAVNAAIAFLKSQPPQAPGAGGNATHGEGPLALAGIALMEAGVDPGDPFIQTAAKSIRERAVQQSKTYQLAL